MYWIAVIAGALVLLGMGQPVLAVVILVLAVAGEVFDRRRQADRAAVRSTDKV